MKGLWARNRRYLFLPALSADLEMKTTSLYKLCLFWQNQSVPSWFLQCQNSCHLLNLLKNDLLTPLLGEQSGYRVWETSNDGLKRKLWTDWFYIYVHEHRVKFVCISFILICGCSVTIYLCNVALNTTTQHPLLLNTCCKQVFPTFPMEVGAIFPHETHLWRKTHHWLTFWLCFNLLERHGHVVKCSDSELQVPSYVLGKRIDL